MRILHLNPDQVRKGDLIYLPGKTHKVVAHAKETKPGVWDIESQSQILRVTDVKRTMRVGLWEADVKRLKVGDSNYDIVDKETGEVYGNAVRTGRPGVDNYPWDWSVDFTVVDGSRTIGNGSTLAECVDYIKNAVRNRTDR